MGTQNKGPYPETLAPDSTARRCVPGVAEVVRTELERGVSGCHPHPSRVLIPASWRVDIHLQVYSYSVPRVDSHLHLDCLGERPLVAPSCRGRGPSPPAHTMKTSMQPLKCVAQSDEGCSGLFHIQARAHPCLPGQRAPSMRDSIEKRFTPRPPYHPHSPSCHPSALWLQALAIHP